MGLGDLIKSAAAAVHTALGDKAQGGLNDAVTYHSAGSYTYDPSTGQNTESGGSDTTSVKALFCSYRNEEIDGDRIKLNDRKVLIAANNLPSITPKITDYITDSNSVVWQVKHVKADPAEAEWVLQCRSS